MQRTKASGDEGRKTAGWFEGMCLNNNNKKDVAVVIAVASRVVDSTLLVLSFCLRLQSVLQLSGLLPHIATPECAGKTSYCQFSVLFFLALVSVLTDDTRHTAVDTKLEEDGGKEAVNIVLHVVYFVIVMSFPEKGRMCGVFLELDLVLNGGLLSLL